MEKKTTIENGENNDRVEKTFKEFIHALVWKSMDIDTNVHEDEINEHIDKYCKHYAYNMIEFINDKVTKFIKTEMGEKIEYDSVDFLDALQHYGELEHDEIMDITNDKPIIIDGKKVDSILDDDGLKFSYIKNGCTFSAPLDIDDIDEEICDKIYEFLCDNRDENIDFFDSLY